MSEPQESRLETIAQHLLREGFMDNEADARLAAIRILLAEDSMRRDPEPAD